MQLLVQAKVPFLQKYFRKSDVFHVAVKIGKTSWILHKINDRDPKTGRRTINLAISDEAKFLSQKNNGSCRPILTDQYFVMEVLKAETIGDDEAIAYFLASPTTNVSLK